MKKILSILLILSLYSCASYKRCREKFATTVVDSVRVQVPVSVLVPRDSVITSFITDTTYYYKEVQQGRAKVIVERTNTITKVQAQCDTVTIIKRVPVQVPVSTLWGVAPWYRTAFFYTAGSLLLVLLILVFVHFFQIKKR